MVQPTTVARVLRSEASPVAPSRTASPDNAFALFPRSGGPKHGRRVVGVRRQAALALGAITVIFLSGVTATSAIDQQLLAFLESGALTVAADAPGDPSLNHVINLAASESTVTIVIVDSKDPAGNAIAAIPGLEGDTVAGPVSVRPGRTLPFVVDPADDAVGDGKYTGQLVAYSSDGGIARRDLAVTFKAASAPSATPQPQLADPLPDPFTMMVTRAWPGWLKETETSTGGGQTYTVSSELAGGAIGPLVSTTGALAMAELRPSPAALVISQYPQPGTYKGAIKVGSGDDAVESPISLSVRDSVAWAITALAIGLFAATRLGSFVADDRRRVQVLIWLAELRETALDQQRAERAKLKSLPPGLPAALRPAEVIRIYERPRFRRASGLLAEASRAAIISFDSAWSRKTRDEQWGPGGAASTSLAGYVSSQAEGLANVQAICAGAGRLLERQTPLPSTSPVVAQAVAAVRPELVMSAARLEQIVASSDSANQLMQAHLHAHDIIDRLVADLVDRKIGSKSVAAKRGSLWASDIGTVEKVGEILTQANTAYRAALDAAAARESDGRAHAPLDLSSEIDVSSSFARSGQPRGLGEIETSAELRRELAWKDLMFGVLSAALVIGTGLTLYFGNPAWGSAGDYVAALVWGTAVGTGVEVARQLGARFALVD